MKEEPVTFEKFLTGHVVATYIEHPINAGAISNLHRLLEGLDLEILNGYMEAAHAHPERSGRLLNLCTELEKELRERSEEKA